ncbi:unnamed protein product [Owenia fusiformis]|uniref:Short-chain dehydrogenase/reductase 3 n=1 Tax=Owenia fusiformis TaxID=6347 RepID=A0A8S4N203_OWEFU|nr:unnamed protein product [Owenia fusiformis]
MLFHWFRSVHKDITNDIVLVTGGGSGLGKQISLIIATHNPKHIVLLGRNEAALTSTRDEIVESGCTSCSYVTCDLADSNAITEKLDTIRMTIGDVTILINNAAVAYHTSFFDSSCDELTRSFQINTLAFYKILRSLIPSMVKLERGHIVNVNSVLGVLPLNGAPFYCSTKAANLGLVESIKDELRSDGCDYIHFTNILPYQIDNTMFSGVKTRFPSIFPPLKEVAVAKEIVEAILTNRENLVLPRYMAFLFFCKSVLPVGVMYALNAFIGVDQCMMGFHVK